MASRDHRDPPAFLGHADSDDDDNSFKPPALSDYALALLQKEMDLANKENTCALQSQQVPKKVNFRNSPENHISSKYHHGEDHILQNNNNNNNNNTAHTNQTDHESMFTKDIPGDFDSYGTSASGQEKAQKTPLNRSSSSGLGSGSGNGSAGGSQTRLRSSTRRLRGFGGLGPPKRTSSTLDDSTKNVEKNMTVEDTPMEDATASPRDKRPPTRSPMYQTPQKNASHSAATQDQPTLVKGIDFEGMNPYQYSRRYNIPSTDLPRLVKIYFEQQKSATRESMYLNSPIRLREAIHNKIEEQLKQEPRYSPKPQQELFKREKSTPVENVIFHDKENRDLPQKRLLSSIERPASDRRPLALLNDVRQQQLQNRVKSLTYQHQQHSGQHKSSDYLEHHYKQVEPLKGADESRRSSKLLNINGKQYEKLELLGKGGSSKVFRVKSLSNKVYAVKKISFDEFDESSIRGFKGEIDLLSKLRDQERVVRLVDYALGQGSLLLVMECGEIDLCHVLARRLDFPMDVEFVRFHANEVLKCVKAVHDAGIVHSDLKPANFLFVKGTMKIIDFGIANAVPEHTMNIYRESQIGTPNYMAPEALIDNNQHLADRTSHKSQWKVGKPSDIWSCGCIIYQMVYGRPPYGGYQGSQRLLAIMNPDVRVPYPDKGLGGVKVPGTAIATIQACLMRDPSQRLTVQELLDGTFLKPRVVSEQFVNDLVKNAITYGVSKTKIDEDELKTLADDVWRRVSQLTL